MGKHCVGSERRIVGTRQKGKLLAAGCVAALAAQGQWAGAATVDWTGSASSNWASGSNWVGGNVPISDLITDSAGFNQVSYANQPDAGTRSVGGIQVGDGSTATAPLTISGTQLTLGINGINLATNAGPVTINSPLTLGTGQTWTNASGSTLAVNGTVTRSAGSTLSIVNSGAGSVTSSTLSNDATGIVGPWATYGTGASTRYATVSGGVVSGYTGGTTASSVSTITSSSTNYDYTGGNVTATGSLVANTIRYAGTGVAITLSNTQSITANGILNASSGNFQVKTAPSSTSYLKPGASGELVLNAANGDIVVGSDVAGTGNLVIAGNKTVKLTNNSPHDIAGKIFVNPGSTLQLGYNTGFANVNGVTLNNGTIYLESNGLATAFGVGDLTINGGAIKRNLGGGTQFLNAGSTINLNGDLLFDTGVGYGLNGTVKLSGNRTITVNDSYNTNPVSTSFNGTIDDNGNGYGLTKTGSGILQFGGSNTFSGPLTVDAGTLNLSANSTQTSTVVAVNSGATLAITNAPTGGASDTFAGLTDGSSGGGTVTYSGTSGVNFNLAGTGSYSFGGVITNISGKSFTLTKSGTGTQILSGANNYAGNTMVSGGKLLINGSLSTSTATVTVQSGGALGGKGTINRDVSVAGGGAFDLRDGGVGTLSLTGTVGLANASQSSNLFFDLGSTLGSNDLLSITGTPMINAGGAVINLNALGSSLASGNYTLITAAGGLGTSAFSLASNTLTVGSKSYSLSLANSTSGAEILTVSAVPEPAALGMVALSLFGVAGARRRRA